MSHNIAAIAATPSSGAHEAREAATDQVDDERIVADDDDADADDEFEDDDGEEDEDGDEEDEEEDEEP